MFAKEYLDTCPTKEEVAQALCDIANHTLFSYPWESCVWKELSEYANLTKDDFWEDFDSLSPIDYINGQTAWRYKTHEAQYTDKEKLVELSRKAKELYDNLQQYIDETLTID